MKLRQPIISVLGHVDHGKTSLLDFIRNSKLINKEAGGITQHIGATEVPKKNIVRIVKNFIPEKNIKIPGLLFIDTPGHKAFTSLRKRGGNISDISILIIDINEGFKPQTEEALEILKSYKTPFIVAANKIDLVNGWISKNNKSIIQNIESQREDVKYVIEEKIYNLVAKISEYGFDSDRFDRVDDFTKKVAIVPISAKTGEGVPELLSTLIGLTQKFLEKKLEITEENLSKGVILEVKEYQGLGKTYDCIIYDGNLKTGDTILALNSFGEVEESKVKCILKPLEMKEIRDKSTKFKTISEVSASAGIKISAPNLKNVQAGMLFISTATKNEELLDLYRQELMDEKIDVEIIGEDNGILVKADTLGSLEALNNILKEHNIKIRKANIGKVTKSDVIDASADIERYPKNALILNFNQNLDDEVKNLAERYKVTIISDDIIYKLVEKAQEWIEEKEKEILRKKLECLVMPFKIKILNGCIFRISNPAIVGVEVLAGTLKKNIPLITNENKKIDKGVKSIKLNNENVQELKKGEQGAVAIEKLVIGRNAEEGTILYSFMGEDNFRKLKKNLDLLSSEEKATLKEIAELMRKENSYWGI